MGINYKDIEDQFIFEKDNDIDSAKSLTINEFEHMIKFMICKHDQDSSWVSSINNSAIYLSKQSRNILKELNNSLDKCYVDGRKRAYNNLLHSNYKFFTSASPETRPDDWTLELLSNRNSITKWMKENARSQNVRDRLGMREVLRDKSDTFASYDLKSAFPGIKVK